jgi:dTDP-glucose 4,6-dehydratase
MRIIVTGGAGFIGSAYVRKAASRGDHLLIIDKMTYASSREAIQEPLATGQATLVEMDICDDANIMSQIMEFQPDKIIHFAAESHVDNSIAAPNDFIQTNIVGTYNLLNVTRYYWDGLTGEARNNFRFHHISTDEVYGDLPHPDDLPFGQETEQFKETTPYKPSSPYSASKAASDHLVQAWHRTYGLPITMSNCSNNYGPFQHVEKLLPKTINNALSCYPIPIYGNGRNIRDWLYVDDHIDAIDLIVSNGQLGSTYNIGASCELTNIDLVTKVLTKLDHLCPIDKNIHNSSRLTSYRDLIVFVNDRAGHDLRYAIDASKIQNELAWQPAHTLEEGLDKTITYFIQKFSDAEA